MERRAALNLFSDAASALGLSAVVRTAPTHAVAGALLVCAVTATSASGDDFVGLDAVAAIVDTPKGPRAVLNVYAVFEVPFIIVEKLESAIVNVVPNFGVIVHAGGRGQADWSPQTAPADGIDSFVTIGGNPGPGNTTVPGAGWEGSGFLSTSIPHGAGWINGTPIVLQGQVVQVPGLGPATLLARFVIVAQPNAPLRWLEFSATVGFNLGPGTPLVWRSDALVTAFPSIGISADFNEDGAVDGADLGILLSLWGTAGPADLNEDGIVDGADLGMLLAAWSSHDIGTPTR